LDNLKHSNQIVEGDFTSGKQAYEKLVNELNKMAEQQKQRQEKDHAWLRQ
jgi:hypothetical protein